MCGKRRTGILTLTIILFMLVVGSVTAVGDVIYVKQGGTGGGTSWAEAYGDIQLKPGTVSYGIDVVTWQIPAGKVHLKTHPLFSHETTNQNTMVVLNPANCKFCPLVGGGLNFKTKFEKDMQIPGQHSKVDGYTTKGGWKWYFPNQYMWMHNIGKDNTA